MHNYWYLKRNNTQAASTVEESKQVEKEKAPFAVVWLNKELPASVLMVFDDYSNGYVDRIDIINVPANPFNEVLADFGPLVMGYKVQQIENHFKGSKSAIWIKRRFKERTTG